MYALHKNRTVSICITIPISPILYISTLLGKVGYNTRVFPQESPKGKGLKRDHELEASDWTERGWFEIDQFPHLEEI